MKTFETLWVKSNITFFTNVYAGFGTICTVALLSFDYPMICIIITNAWDNLLMMSQARGNIR